MSCGPGRASPSDGITTADGSTTQPEPSSTTHGESVDGETDRDDADGGSSASVASTNDTETEPPFGGWGEPELVAELESRGGPGLYPETIVAAGSFVFASTSQGFTTWRIDTETLGVDTAAAGGRFLGTTDSWLYLAAAEGFSPCCVRLSLESLESSVVAGSGQLAGSQADGIAMFRVSDTPRPQTGVLSWFEDASDTDVDVFASPDLRRVLGVSSAAIVVQLADDLTAIEIGSWSPTTIGEGARWVDAVLWSEVSDEFVYLATESDLRIIALDGSLDTTLNLTVSGPEADVLRLVWVDSSDGFRIWASAPDGSKVEPVVEAELPISQLALGVDALYWLSTMGRVYRLPYPS